VSAFLWRQTGFFENEDFGSNKNGRGTALGAVNCFFPILSKKYIKKCVIYEFIFFILTLFRKKRRKAVSQAG